MVAIRSIALGILFSCLPVVWGSTIYNNGTPDLTTPCTASCPSLTTSGGSGLFSLVAGADVTGLRFWTFQTPTAYNGGTLEWEICQDSLCSPGSKLGSGTFKFTEQPMGPINIDGFDALEYQHDIAVGPLTITPSSSPQNYFLNITDMGGPDTFGIFWATSGVDTLAFQVFGTGNDVPNQTPEPSTFVLISGGIACLVARRMWPRKSAKSS